jgi:hypothetical protein
MNTEFQEDGNIRQVYFPVGSMDQFAGRKWIVEAVEARRNAIYYFFVPDPYVGEMRMNLFSILEIELVSDVKLLIYL